VKLNLTRGQVAVERRVQQCATEIIFIEPTPARRRRGKPPIVRTWDSGPIDVGIAMAGAAAKRGRPAPIGAALHVKIVAPSFRAKTREIGSSVAIDTTRVLHHGHDGLKRGKRTVFLRKRFVGTNSINPGKRKK
jgi:hypothetical protein